MCSLLLRTQPSEGSLQAFLVTLIFTKYNYYDLPFWLSYIFCICVNYSTCIWQNNRIKSMTRLLYFVAVNACFQSGVTVQCFQITSTALMEFLPGAELWLDKYLRCHPALLTSATASGWGCYYWIMHQKEGSQKSEKVYRTFNTVKSGFCCLTVYSDLFGYLKDQLIFSKPGRYQ